MSFLFSVNKQTHGQTQEEKEMACFIVPAAGAIVTTCAKSKVKKHEFSRKLGWLGNLLWGGSAMLAFEHIWHGEITPVFPFITSAVNAGDASSVIHEMSTVGAAMVAAVTAVWIGMLAVSKAAEKKTDADEACARDTKTQEM